MPIERRVLMSAIGATLALSACSAQHSASSPHSPAKSTIHLDYPKSDDLTQLTAKASIIIRGRITTTKADLTDVMNRGTSQTPSVGRIVDVTKVYKGKTGKQIWVAVIDDSRVIAEPVSPLVPNEDVMLFLQPRRTTFDGLDVHSITGLDQGYISIDKQGASLKPRGHKDAVPLPDTLAELEKVITTS